MIGTSFYSYLSSVSILRPFFELAAEVGTDYDLGRLSISSFA